MLNRIAHSGSLRLVSHYVHFAKPVQVAGSSGLDFLELELGADIDARLHSWQVSV